MCSFLRKRRLLGGRVIPLPRMFTLGKQKVIPGMLAFQSMSNLLDLVPTRVCLTQKNTPQKNIRNFKSALLTHSLDLPPPTQDSMVANKGFCIRIPRAYKCLYNACEDCILQLGVVVPRHTPLKFNSSPLKNDGWKMSFLLGLPIFRGYDKFLGV